MPIDEFGRDVARHAARCRQLAAAAAKSRLKKKAVGIAAWNVQGRGLTPKEAAAAENGRAGSASAGAPDLPGSSPYHMSSETVS